MITLMALRIGSGFGILKDQLFCFDNRYRITAAQRSGNIVINIDLNDKNIPDFFGAHVSSLTAVVGRNGVGKSTLLRYLKELFTGDKGDLHPREDDIIIFREEEKIKILANESYRSKLEFTGSISVDETFFYRGYPKIFDRIKNLAAVYYSNSPDFGQSEKEYGNFFNISTSFLLQHISRLDNRFRNLNLRHQNSHNRFRFTELKRQMDFLRYLKTTNDSIGIPFRSVEKLQLTVKELPVSEYERLDTDIDYTAREVSKSQLSSQEEAYLQETIKNLGLTFSAMQEFFSNLKKNSAPDNQVVRANIIVSENLFFLLLDGLKIELFGFINDARHFATLADWIIGSWKEITPMMELTKTGFLEAIAELQQRLDNSMKLRIGFIPVESNTRNVRQLLANLHDLGSFFNELRELAVYENNALYFETDDPRIDKILERYYTSTMNLRFMNFDWSRLSAGEEALISFFARLHRIAATNRKNKNMLLLIDEGDLYFHPEWQRKYIFFLLSYLRNITGFESVQVVLTTHSPFIVADLPQENIIFMDRGDFAVKLVRPEGADFETFGGNLHALYAKAFFLGSTTTSEFALQKIKEEIVAPLSQSGQIDLTAIEALIQLVGEPVIKMALEERLKRRVSNGTNNQG